MSLLTDVQPERIIIVCERIEDGSRFHHPAIDSGASLRCLRATAQGHYMPLYLIRVRPK